jgi:hypothetical protein
MWKNDLTRKKIWFENYREEINERLDEFYSSVPDTGLTDRERYLYDTAQNQFKMLYELVDHSTAFINSELTLMEGISETRRSADTQS